MIVKCSSANRCARIDCSRCARRYACRAARDFQGQSTGQIYTIAISTGIRDLEKFRQWRISVWNIFNYRRQTCRWWQDVTMRAWLSNDGRIRGVVSLGSITGSEFDAALGARWPITLRRINPEALFDELHAVVRPGTIMADDPDHARYQPRQMTVRPRRARTCPKRPGQMYMPDLFDEPMPLLIG